jgi:hypothetical protein
MSPIPVVRAVLGSFLPRRSISASGAKLARLVNAPRHKPISPGQPHRTAAAMVAIIPVVFLSMLMLLSAGEYIHRGLN